MASRKLTDADKQAILELYRQPGETTSTLAERYGVSNSTISRVLKQHLPEEEYGRLIQQKRSGAKSDTVPAPDAPSPPPTPTPKVKPEASDLPEVVEASQPTEAAPSPEESEKPKPKPAPPIRRRDQPSSEVSSLEVSGNGSAQAAQNGATSSDDADDDNDNGDLTALAWDDDGEETAANLDGDDYGDDDLDDDEDDLDDWDDDDDDDGEDPAPTLPRHEQLEILPFSDASFQRTYYLVVDRLSELITCPLRDFSDLGRIPEEEEQSRTLPVFNNHRVARRFSRRNQRVVKVPDGNVIRKTQPYLQAKGITRLLLDGQVYALT